MLNKEKRRKKENKKVLKYKPQMILKKRNICNKNKNIKQWYWQTFEQHSQ